MAHENYKEMLPALALSALDAEDQRELNEHLAQCDECRRELADWESTAAALALSAPPAEPSAQVRDRIMSAVQSESQKQPRQGSRVVEFPQSRRARWTAFGRVGAVAAAVLFLFLIIWIVVLWQENRSLRRRTDELYSQIAIIGEESHRANELTAILSSAGAKVTPLSGTGPGAGASARLVYNDGGRAMLIAEALPPVPAGKEYQLWFIVGKNPPIPGKTFTPDDIGRGDLTDDVPRQARDSAVFAVTLEPAGGSISPTSAIYLRSGL